MVIEERAYWLAWSRLHRVGPILLKRLYSHFGSLAIAWQAPPQDLLLIEGIGSKLAESISAQRSGIDPATLLAQTAPCLTPVDASYPSLLFEICDPPPVLYYRGRRELLEQIDRRISVGIVGTRHPTDYGRRWTREITRQLVQQDRLIISGLASGIDREAHQSTLDHQGQTIAVLGTGVNVVYPAANRRLYNQILETGLIISEYPDGTPPDRPHFPQRNRIIAGLSRAVIVTEAPERSGALITAHLANDYGREVYALPGSLDNSQIRGCLRLIEQGAQMVLSAKTLLGDLQALPAPATAPARPQLSQELQPIYAAVTADGISLDALVEHLGLETGHLLSGLMQLEVMELVTQLPGMRYRRC